MNDKVIEYKSEDKKVGEYDNILEEIDRDGIECTWNGYYYDNGSGWRKTYFSWNFDWSKLKDQGVERITGYLIVRGTENSPNFGEHRIDVDLKETYECVTKQIVIEQNSEPVFVTFEYHLTEHFALKIDKIPYEEMFAASEMNDTVLVIEGKKAHVNKAFLSYHSEFFRALFSPKFKEGKMSKIPIEEVSYEDFGLLMSTIYPMQVFPTDETSEKLLELANRFLLPSVTRIVEYHLINKSYMNNEQLMRIADAYGLKSLLEKCIRAMDTVEKAKQLKESNEYQQLSLKTIEKLFCRLLQLS